MRVAILATIFLWALIFGLIYLCFPTLGFAAPKESRIVIPFRTYYKLGYQAVSEDWARSMHRIAIRRTERILPVRFSHRFEVIPATVVPHERDFVGCYRIPSFENGACCPMEYIERHRVETKAWRRKKEVPMFINPPVGGNSFYDGSWLTGGIALGGCWGGNPAVNIGIVNATEVNIRGERRKHASAEVYRHELMHTAFNADHLEIPHPLNVMQTFGPVYNQVEKLLEEQFVNFPDVGLPTLKQTLDAAKKCIKLNRKEQKLNKR